MKWAVPACYGLFCTSNRKIQPNTETIKRNHTHVPSNPSNVKDNAISGFPLKQLDSDPLEMVMGKFGGLPTKDMANLRQTAKLFHRSHNPQAPPYSVVELYHQKFPFAEGSHDNPYEMYRFCIREALEPHPAGRASLIYNPVDCLQQVDRLFPVTPAVRLQIFYDFVAGERMTVPVLQHLVQPLSNFTDSVRKQMVYRGVRAVRQDIVSWVWRTFCPYILEDEMPIHCERALFLLARNQKLVNFDLPGVGNLEQFRSGHHFANLRKEYFDHFKKLTDDSKTLSWIVGGGDSHQAFITTIRGRQVLLSHTSLLLLNTISSRSMGQFQHAVALGLDINQNSFEGGRGEVDVYSYVFNFNSHDYAAKYLLAPLGVLDRLSMPLSRYIRSTVIPDLFSHGLDVNYKIVGIKWPLIAVTSEVAETKDLLAKGADLVVLNHKPSILPFWITRNGQYDKMIFLMHPKFGLDFYQTSPSDGASALWGAATSGNYKMVRHFLEHFGHVNKCDHLGNSVLVSALRAYEASQVVGFGTVVFSPSDSKRALFLILEQKTLLLNHQNNAGRSALMLASLPESVKWLLSHGADPNLQDREGQTALMLAHSVPVIQALLRSDRIDVKLKDATGKTALDLFILNNQYALLRALLDGVSVSKARALVTERHDALRGYNAIEAVRASPSSPEQQAILAFMLDLVKSNKLVSWVKRLGS